MPNIGELLVKLLAVIGGALVGGLGSGWLTQIFTKLLVHRSMPRWPLLGVRGLGAAAAGLAMWLFVFGSGGSGFGLGGGGLGFNLGGPGSGTGEGTGPTHLIPVTTANSTKPPATLPEPPPHDQVVRVEMLGGDRYKGDDRYYLLEGSKGSMTLEEVRQFIDQRRKDTPPLKEVEIVILLKGSVARGHPAVSKLSQLAEDRGLTVRLNSPGTDKN